MSSEVENLVALVSDASFREMPYDFARMTRSKIENGDGFHSSTYQFVNSKFRRRFDQRRVFAQMRANSGYDCSHQKVFLVKTKCVAPRRRNRSRFSIACSLSSGLPL